MDKNHGPLCRLNRTLKPSLKRECQGRPLGLLVAWAMCSEDYLTQQDHIAASQRPLSFFTEKLDFLRRQQARFEFDARFPDASAWVAQLPERPTYPGEGPEPVEMP